jgi:hypothetical protein
MTRIVAVQHGGQRDVLVGIKTGQSGSLVCGDLRFYFGVRTHIRPCVHQVLGAQVGQAASNACSRSQRGFASIEPRVCPREGVTKLLHNPLQNLRPFAR